MLGSNGNNGNDRPDMATALNERIAQGPTTPGVFRNGGTGPTPYADFDQAYDAVSPETLGQSPSAYTVRNGDSLESIAAQIWGDASLWYMIAEANPSVRSTGSGLAAGTSLIIPNKVANFHNTADTFRPYDAERAVGDTQPGTPKPPKANKGCGVFGQIISTIVAVAASYFLGPILGNVVSQGFNNVIGLQDGFSFKSLAISVISAGVTAGLNGAFAGIQSAFVQGALQSAAANAITQGISVATGLQQKFDWLGVASAGVVGGVSSFVSAKIDGRTATADPITGKTTYANNASTLGSEIVSGVAGGIAGAATRSIATGTDFGDNLMAVLPDVVGSITGRRLAMRLDVDGNGEIGKQKLDSTESQSNSQSFWETLRDISYFPSSVIAQGIRGARTEIERNFDSIPYNSKLERLFGRVSGDVNKPDAFGKIATALNEQRLERVVRLNAAAEKARSEGNLELANQLDTQADIVGDPKYSRQEALTTLAIARYGRNAPQAKVVDLIGDNASGYVRIVDKLEGSSYIDAPSEREYYLDENGDQMETIIVTANQNLSVDKDTTVGRLAVDGLIYTQDKVQQYGDYGKYAIIAAKTVATGGIAPLISIGIEKGVEQAIPYLPESTLNLIAKGGAAVEDFLGGGGGSVLLGTDRESVVNRDKSAVSWGATTLFGVSIGSIAIKAGNWKDRVRQGRDFDTARRGVYGYDQVDIRNPSGSGKRRVDSINMVRGTEQIISRKHTQFSGIKESTAVGYIDEIERKYAPGSVIADTPRNRELGIVGQRISGPKVLEIPVQRKPIPPSILDYATKHKVIIRDVNGKVY